MFLLFHCSVSVSVMASPRKQLCCPPAADTWVMHAMALTKHKNGCYLMDKNYAWWVHGFP